jgi:hypothetical protein
MIYVLQAGTLIGLVVGLFHAVDIYRDLSISPNPDGSANRLRAFNFSAWTLLLWIVAGGYVLIFWILGSALYLIFKAFRQ